MSILSQFSEEALAMDQKSMSSGNSLKTTAMTNNNRDLSWQNIRKSVRTLRKNQAKLANKFPHNFCFVPLANQSNEMGSKFNQSEGSRLLFLGVLPGYRDNTLLYIDIPSTHSPNLLDKPVEWKQALGSFQVLTYLLVPLLYVRQWLFCCRWQFTLRDYFAVSCL